MIDPARALRLDGRVALVTGGTRGIGRAIVEGFVAAGAAVGILARKPEELDETRRSVEDRGGRAVAHAGSAGDPDAVDGAVAACLDAFGRLDIVVNNAATNPAAAFAPLVDADPGAVRKILEVNVEGPLRVVAAAWHRWMREHGGVVLNVASVGGLRASPAIGAYNVSKAALVHLTRQLASELAPGVRVNAVAPGLVKTDMSRALFAMGEEAANAMHPLGRYGTPDDVAAAALFLVSDAASWITGEVLVVDGGGMV